MFDQVVLRLALAPFSILFGIGVAIKNLLYQTGLLSGVRFSVPMINVGNLTVGGAGKTPHVEYLIRLLSPYIPVASLSRGYKRKTRGFRLVRPGHSTDIAGDEALLYARKYPKIAVAVSESRALGVPKLLQARPQIRAVILDDAYQHRAVSPDVNILLTEFDMPFYKDWLMPSGRLREWRSGYKRADIIIVTKCPPDMTREQRAEISRHISLQPGQRLFFSMYAYFPLYSMFEPTQRVILSQEHEILLISGIARTSYLLDYLGGEAGSVKILQFEDHHDYSRRDLELIKKHFELMESSTKLIVTTEKDAMRLEAFRDFLLQNDLTIHILPIQVQFLFGQQKEFDETIREYLLNFTI